MTSRTLSALSAERASWAAMSTENVDLHRRAVEAFNTRDVEKFIALCDPQIELHSAVTVSAYHGHGGVRRWHRDLQEAFGDEVRIEPEAYFDLGEHTVTFHVLQGRGRHSGATVAEPFAHVHRWRDGLTIYFKAYAHQEDALRDLGVSGTAQPIRP
jgi:ketosteroid isomerase-like protein